MRSLALGSLLLGLCLPVCAGQESGDVLDLAADHPVSVLLTPERFATLRLNLGDSKAEEVFLDAAVPDISYRVVATDGTEILSGRLATFGWACILVASTGQHEVQIRLSTEGGADGLPGVRVRVEGFPVPLNSWPERVRATQAFNIAQPLHHSLRREDLRRAIQQFEQAAGEWALADDLAGEALALGGRGESEIELSRYEDARRTLEHALSLSENNGYLRGWLLHLQARALFDQWEGKRAQAYAQEELRLGQEIGDAALIALARTDLAGVAFWLRDSKMTQIVDQAHLEAIAAGTPETLALERRWNGWVEEYNERAVRAVSALSESESYFRRVGDWRDALVAVLEGAVAVSLNGDLYSALARFSKLEPETRASGNDMVYGLLLGDIGYEYKELNKPRLAETYFRRAESAYSHGHIRFGLILSHGYLCETELRLNETTNAVSDCKLALRLARQFGDTAFLGEALYKLGDAERKGGSAGQAFSDFTEAAKYSQANKDTRWESKAHLQIGELLEQQGKRQRALAEFEQAELLSRGVADPASLIEAQYAVSRRFVKDRKFKKADAELALALEQVEATRQSVSSSTLQATYFAAERKIYELAVELRMLQFDRRSSGASNELALDVSERGRARGLLDVLSARAASGPPEGGEAEARRLRARLAVDRAFDHRLKLIVESGAQVDLKLSSAELAQVLGDLERVEDEVSNAKSPGTKVASTMSAAEIKTASLRTGMTFFEYALGADRSFLWVIAGEKLKSYVLPPRPQIENMVKQWRTLALSQNPRETEIGAKFRHLSSQLSCALFADAVEARMTKMVIVPDGDLAMLPFAALPEHGCSSASGEPLIVNHEITFTPSLSVFLSRKPKVGGHSFQGEVAIVSDPVFDAADSRVTNLKIGAAKPNSNPARNQEITAALPRLLNTGHEASAIQDTVRKAAGNDQVFLAQGFNASVETVLSPAMRRYRIWHLATHGVYDESMPEFSGLVFSLVGPDGSPRFGFLKAHDIAQLNIPAELVVLSACDSAEGENVNGEGVMGLSYAFLHAGAKQVISTLWSVDDARSKDLMIAFYREFMQNGRNAAEALRQSQVAVMRQSRNSAPYYWAGFELTSAGK